MTAVFSHTAQIDYPILDADAHVNEPPQLWQERVPAKWRERAPKVLHTDAGDVWSFDDGKRLRPLGLTAAAGGSYLDFRPDGLRYDEIRPGSFDAKARLQDMDADGIYAQVLYPSVTLNGAQIYASEPALQQACVRAYNEWMVEFCEGSDGRLVGQGIIPMTGLDDAVGELKRTLEVGLKGAVIGCYPNGTLTAADEDDAFWGLAQEADFPIGVHIGSFGPIDMSERGRSMNTLALLGAAGSTKAGGMTLPVACSLLFSGIFEKFPRLKVLLVEANIGWIPTLLEQTDDMFLRYRWFTGAVEKMKLMPSDIFHRNMWSTFMVDTVGMELRHRININHVMWSTDYPHTGTDWPNSRVTLERVFRGVPLDEVKAMTHDNCKSLYHLDYIPDSLAG